MIYTDLFYNFSVIELHYDGQAIWTLGRYTAINALPVLHCFALIFKYRAATSDEETQSCDW